MKREIRIRTQSRKYQPVYTAHPPRKDDRKPVIEEITFPSVQWVLGDWGRWMRSLPVEYDNFEQLDFSSEAAESWYITDDHAFQLEPVIKELEKYNAFMMQCICKYYLTRNMSVDLLASMKAVGQTKARGALRAGEAWIHSQTYSWVDPLYREHLKWEAEKQRRRSVAEKVVDGLRAQKV